MKVEELYLMHPDTCDHLWDRPKVAEEFKSAVAAKIGPDPCCVIFDQTEISLGDTVSFRRIHNTIHGQIVSKTRELGMANKINRGCTPTVYLVACKENRDASN